ncbi:A-kinase anchor protein 10, mitochondrial [Cephus cinctus]|uniref:A-kinase anchor protein 10, mitochondrial n=1 Tax=Cephus cinctus TaxID=211228 RepID=A0AAJ7C7C6_CEPCN|nr:A-kinase anchor protein 10, mitochondrial [Cephus cinctus]
MLQFFRKSGFRDKSRSSQNSPAKSTSSGTSPGKDGYVTSQIQAGTLCSLEEEEESNLHNEHKTDISSFRSRLSKTLPEILADKGALGYFIQFLESRGCIGLIKLWLEVECLQGATSTPESLEEEKLPDVSDHRVDEFNSLSSSSDNNDSPNCSIVAKNSNYHDSDQLSNDLCVHSNEVKSNCNHMPKTSQPVRRARQSNRISGSNRCKATTTGQDALRIYKKYIVKGVLGANHIQEELRSEMEEAFSTNNVERILKCLSVVQRIVYKIIEDEHVNDFLRSDFHCKHQIDVLTSGNVQLSDILYNETAFFYFMEFMELENKRELLDFWMAAVNYKQNLLEKDGTTDPLEAETDALIIYDKYFSLQATMPLGFSDKIRFQVEQNICREGGKGPEPDCFDRPCTIVYNFLNKHYLAAFLSSQLYYKYLSELISTIQSSPCPDLHPRIRRAGSDCSSEISTVSISTQSTLQAGNEENRLTNNSSSVNGSMSIDTRQLYDPDSLWRRTKYKLSVGYVDGMGRFVTEIEPDPQRKYESRLSRVVKRLVKMEQDKAKEEMAWKIAEMIIREITSLTLGTSNLPS